MSAENDQAGTGPDERKKVLNQRLEGVAWGLFIITIGVLWLQPEGRLPESSWLVAAGVIMLGLNVVRYLGDVKLSGFSIVLGLLALTVGVAGVYGIELPFIPILLIVIGASVILKPLVFPGGKFACPCSGKDARKDKVGCC